MKIIGLWRSSIFLRLILTFLVIMVPLYGIGISMYKWGVTALKQEISAAKEAQMTYYLEKIGNEIQGLKLVQSETLYNDDINRLANDVAYLDDYERGNYLNKLQQRLSAIKNGSNYVENVTAFIPAIRRSIPAVGSIGELYGEDMKRMTVFDNSAPSQLIFTEGRLYLNAFFPPNYIKESPQPLYSVLIKLSTPWLKESLKQFNLNEHSGAFLIDARNRLPVADTGAAPAKERILQVLGSEDNGSGSMIIDGERYLYIFRTSPYLGLTLVNYFPERALFAGLQKYELWFWVLSIAVLLIVVLFSLVILRFIRMPLYMLIKGFKRLENGDMDFRIGYRFEDEFGFLYTRFNAMLERLKSLIDQNYKQTIMVQRAELKQLQAQINPHFLYNSFFILYTMTKRGDYDKLMRFQLQLGEYFQYLTRNASDEVTLEREVSHARAYCDIQTMRFANRIRVEFDELPPGYADMAVPRLILQPIIENAFEYGLENMEENGLLQIRFAPEPGGLRIEVENNGTPMSEEAIRKLESGMESPERDEVTGLLNIHRRIRLLFKNGSGLSVASGRNGVTITIWLETGQEEEQHVYAVNRG